MESAVRRCVLLVVGCLYLSACTIVPQPVDVDQQALDQKAKIDAVIAAEEPVTHP